MDQLRLLTHLIVFTICACAGAIMRSSIAIMHGYERLTRFSLSLQLLAQRRNEVGDQTAAGFFPTVVHVAPRIPCQRLHASARTDVGARQVEPLLVSFVFGS